MILCFLEKGQQDIELLLSADSWERNWQLEDFGLFGRDGRFLRGREQSRSGRMPSRRISVFDVFGTEDSETINTPPFPIICIS